MKLRTVVLIAAAGGFAYVHYRRGGQLTLQSFAETLRSIFGRSVKRAQELKDEAERAAVHDVATNVAKATERPLH